MFNVDPNGLAVKPPPSPKDDDDDFQWTDSGPGDPTYLGNGGQPLNEVTITGNMNLSDMYYNRIDMGLDPFQGYARGPSVQIWYNNQMAVYHDIANNQFHRFAYDAASFYAGGEIGGAALGGLFDFGKGLLAGGTGRVFWSGGDVAKTAAAEFAKANGMKTLEMTTRGGIMDAVTRYLPASISSPIWSSLPKGFADGAVDEAHFFTIQAGPRAGSIWLTIEKPILEQNGINIISH